MKFDVWKDIVSQSSHFKSRQNPMTLGEGGGAKIWGKRLEWRDRDETWREK